jgi:hypothetical protein
MAVRTVAIIIGAALALLVLAPLHAQTNATLQGRVFDQSGAVIARATVSLRTADSGLDRTTVTDAEGRYQLAGIPAGRYEVMATAPGFRAEIIEQLSVEVGRSLVRDFRLQIGESRETVVVEAEFPLIERASTSVGHVVTAETVQEIPLNGRRFTDLALLVPGSVAPSHTGFSTTPIRGVGAMAINTSGNREEAVAFVVNGVSTNNLTFGSLSFQPSVASIQEFNVNNSAFGPEHGHVSGAIVSILTRSGTDTFRGEAFEFFRDEALDARNFFEFTSDEPHPFRRNQFGGSLGGPVVRGRAFFFVTYEGLRQRQGLDVNSLVLSHEQRASVSDPTVRRLVQLIPHPNLIDAGGAARFVGSAEAIVDTDRWSVDVQQNVGTGGRWHVFFTRNHVSALEPLSQGTTIPGFGHQSRTGGSILTIGHTHVAPRFLNEARFGRSALHGTIVPAASLNPVEFGIANGVMRPIGLPQLTIAGGLSFGGPAGYPTGRSDASYLLTDTVHLARGPHALKFGAEYRHFLNENFVEGTGAFNFPTVDAFLSGTANAFSVTLGERRNHISQRALGLFAQDSVTVRSNLTIELGMRYEWHVTPTERDNQFVVFDAATASLWQVGVDTDRIYQQNNLNFEPRVGVVWDPTRDGRTVMRAAYGWAVDEPGTTAVRDTTSNPPFAIPVTASGAIAIPDALATTRPVGLAPATTDSNFRNASVQSWNVNIQRQVASSAAATIGYFGSSGRHLRISRNVNQPIAGVRPFPAVSPTSPILPGTPLGNITQVESTGFSSYHALWLSALMRRGRGLQFDTSYTWSKSLDTNSLNSSGFAVQDAYDIPNQYGLSDFDARHRFVLSAIYDLPFTGHALTRGWQIAAIVQSQSGNPVNIVTSNSSLTGTPNTVRPDVTGPIRTIGSVEQWFDTSVFVAVDGFGNLGRNVVIGPGFHNTDVSVIKNARVGQRLDLEFRADVFNVFNHANFGPPGNIVGSPTFGQITRTRLATGEAGSSRQIQFAVKASF